MIYTDNFHAFGSFYDLIRIRRDVSVEQSDILLNYVLPELLRIFDFVFVLQSGKSARAVIQDFTVQQDLPP